MKKEEVDGLVTKANPSLTPSGLSRPLSSGMLRPSRTPAEESRRSTARAAAAAPAADIGGGDIFICGGGRCVHRRTWTCTDRRARAISYRRPK